MRPSRTLEKLIRTLCAPLLVAGLAGCDPDEPEAQWEPAFDTEGAGFLSSVWGSGPDDVFVVGGTETATIRHYDGSAWSAMTPPESAELLVWTFGFGPDDVYAVGLGGTVIHYDGAVWTTLTPPTDQDLWGVWGRAPNDIWIVGGTVADGEPVLLHYDGATFTDVGLDAEQNPFGARALFKVWGIGTKTFAVGQGGLIVELDGGSWVRRPAGEAADQDFIALTGNAEDNIVVCGGRSGSRIAVYDGTGFTTVKPEATGGTSACFMESDGTTYVGGVPGYVGTFDASAGDIEIESEVLQEIHAIWGDGECRTYAVGGLALSPFPGVAIVKDEC